MTPESDASAAVGGRGARLELVGISVLLLFLELACIRWFPAHVLYLTFFTNIILLASFLGMSFGCLRSDSKRSFIAWTAPLLALGMVLGYAIEHSPMLRQVLKVGNQRSPQVVYFGAESAEQALPPFVIPIEAVGALFFALVAVAMIGPGQEMGRALSRIRPPIVAYSLNILGSLMGIALFAGMSWFELGPGAWFALAGAGLLWWLRRLPLRLPWRVLGVVAVVSLPVLASVSSLPGKTVDGADQSHFWSPYYRIDYAGPPHREISVNLIGHQVMNQRGTRFAPQFFYDLPHLLQRDSGGEPFGSVLVIGAGSGNDVAAALDWGAARVDAVDIDPVIQRLGKRDHPDQPFQDERVRLHLDDGRNFLREGEDRYDLIVYALVDSLVLHSGYSNIRLESYLFTEEAFTDARRRLAPGGVLVVCNYFRQGWVVARIEACLREVFGAEPVVVPIPHDRIDAGPSGGFTIIMAGEVGAIEGAFEREGGYGVRLDRPTGTDSSDGFRSGATGQGSHERIDFLAATVQQPADLRLPTDDWPFLYLRRPMLPALTIRSMVLLAAASILLFAVFRPRDGQPTVRSRLAGRMFFLGAGFMLIEAKAVVQMALLFGSTWMVNSIVFMAVLIMILGANLFVLKRAPAGVGYAYGLLGLMLVLNWAIPLESFLGLPDGARMVASCALVFAPILFAGVVFAISFARSTNPSGDLGANIAGAMLGGLMENASMLVGFRNLTLAALLVYGLSAIVVKQEDSGP